MIRSQGENLEAWGHSVTKKKTEPKTEAEPATTEPTTPLPIDPAGEPNLLEATVEQLQHDNGQLAQKNAELTAANEALAKEQARLISANLQLIEDLERLESASDEALKAAAKDITRLEIQAAQLAREAAVAQPVYRSLGTLGAELVLADGHQIDSKWVQAADRGQFVIDFGGLHAHEHAATAPMSWPRETLEDGTVRLKVIDARGAGVLIKNCEVRAAEQGHTDLTMEQHGERASRFKARDATRVHSAALVDLGGFQGLALRAQKGIAASVSLDGKRVLLTLD